MTVRTSRDAINLREKLSELDKPSGIAGQDILKADTPQEVFNYIGAGRRNLIINGAMQVWQRSESASFLGHANFSTVDRFMFWLGTGSGSTSKQTDVLNGESFNYLRIVNDGNGTNGAAIFLRQHLEDLAYLGGKTTTLSFRAKASAAIDIGFYQRQSYGSGGSATENISGTSSTTLSTSWQDYSVTLPAWNTMSGKTIGTNAYAMLGFQTDDTVAWTLDITNIQLEVGSVATPFERRSYGEELALCQRYYWQLDEYTMPYTLVCSTNQSHAIATYWFPCTMRATPSAAASGDWRLYGQSGSSVVDTTTATVAGVQTRLNGGRIYFSRVGDAFGEHWVDWQPTGFKLTLDAEL